MLSELLQPPGEAALLDPEPLLARDVLFGPALADLPHATDPADALAWAPAPPRFALALAALAMATVTLDALVVLPASLAPTPHVIVATPAAGAADPPIRFARASAHHARQER